ncbi:GntR family transcriptional regulator [Companilactobacillus metriopterae]|uniref:GntR family transcriptional regulator n=1 Tax=Companilactobacillus metriopterae TaxID=1909267 RepID=UPI00100A5EF6|nr:GntR family transcriptional regulator [Companilactobacillus metriopterae]
MEFKDNIPIYLQIEDLIRNNIVNNEYHLGDKIPSVRELSLELSVNINTVQKAISNLVDDGIVITKRGQGNFVTEDVSVIDKLREDQIHEIVEEMYDALSALNLDNDQIISKVKTYIEKRGN